MSSAWKNVLSTALLLGAIAGVIWYVGVYWPKQQALQAVADTMIDPWSAQFRNVRLSGSSYCGEVNAKNRMGAYTGFSPFLVFMHDEPLVLMEKDDRNPNLGLAEHCKPKD